MIRAGVKGAGVKGAGVKGADNVAYNILNFSLNVMVRVMQHKISAFIGSGTQSSKCFHLVKFVFL